jgi:hypothetical protein
MNTPDQQRARARNKKTTTAGLIAALALALAAAADALRDNEWSLSDTGLVLAALAIGLQGLVSRDFDVSSEGQQVQRPRD